MTLYLQTNHLEAIRKHGEQTYPRECCGLLLGTFKGDDKTVHELWRVDNSWDGGLEVAVKESIGADAQGSERRFLISPQDYLDGQKYARDKNLDIIGNYHSHPDHPARPSQFDVDTATFSGYSHIIVAIEKGASKDLTCWLFNDDRAFEPETLQTLT